MKIKNFWALGLLFALAACGGGGGETPPVGSTTTVVSPMTFPLRAARQALVTNGMSETYTVSGTCAGTATITAPASTGGAVFETVSGRIAFVKTTALSYSNCTPAAPSFIETDYYDTNYVRLGTSSSTQIRVLASPVALPAIVMVGDAGTVGTMDTYDSAHARTGTVVVTYSIEAETASTAIFDVAYRTYNLTNALTLTQHDRFRVAQTGALKLLSVDLQYAAGFTGHWVVQSGGSAGASALTFPVGAARQAMLNSGLSKSFTVSGTCAGTTTVTLAPSIAGASFNGVSGRISSMSTTSVNFSNCTPNTLNSAQTDFYDTNYIRVGSSSATQYRVFDAPANMPATVKVGDSATVGTMSAFSDSTKSVVTGKAIVRFNVEADTATTAIYDVITETYNAANPPMLTLTEHDRYRVAQSGPLEFISIDVQYANGSTTHLFMQ